MTQEVFNAIDEFIEAAQTVKALSDALCCSSDDVNHGTVIAFGWMILDELEKIEKQFSILEKAVKGGDSNVQ